MYLTAGYIIFYIKNAVGAIWFQSVAVMSFVTINVVNSYNIGYLIFGIRLMMNN